MKIRLLALLIAPLLLTACGGDDDQEKDGTDPRPPTSDTASSDESKGSQAPPSSENPTMPTCEEVWVPGRAFPADYAGCTSEGEVATNVWETACKSGDSVFYGFEDPETGSDKYFAVTGGSVQPATDEDGSAYEVAYEACLG